MTKTTFLYIATLITSTFIIGCNNCEKSVLTDHSSKPTFDLVSAKKEIEEAKQIFMKLVANGDSVGIANLYTTDAKLMFPDEPTIVGRANIQSTFSRILNSGVTKVELKTKEVFGTAELLAEEGEVTVFIEDKAVSEEKSIILWKKEEGKWKMFLDFANASSPQPFTK